MHHKEMQKGGEIEKMFSKRCVRFSFIIAIPILLILSVPSSLYAKEGVIKDSSLYLRPTTEAVETADKDNGTERVFHDTFIITFALSMIIYGFYKHILQKITHRLSQRPHPISPRIFGKYASF